MLGATVIFLNGPDCDLEVGIFGDLQLGPGHLPRALFQPSSEGLVLQQLDLLIGADRAANGLCRQATSQKRQCRGAA
jgi:hypothetical protein